jgi:hypothetical protein
MGKPGGTSFTTVRGGNGNDNWTVNPSVLLNTIYDGRGGFDTLTLNTTLGVSISVNNGTGNSLSWIVVGTGYSGTPLAFDEPRISTLPGAVAGTITNIEKIVGGSGNDRLETVDAGFNFLDGAAGNDYISSNGFGSDILVGGAGQDYLRGYDRTIVVGGNWDGNLSALPTGDGSVDKFQNAGVVLGFEVGTDVLVFEGSPALIGSDWYETTWVDSRGVGHDAIAIDTWRGDIMFTLVGVAIEDASSVMGNAEYLI